MTAALAAVCPAVTHAAGAGDRFIRGIVRDSVSAQGLPYASVTVQPSGASAVASADGIFEINLPEGSLSITAGCQGYAPRTVPVKKSGINLYDIYLQPVATELRELEVRRKKYSKRNNPAVDFARRIKEAGKDTDPRRNDYYSFDRYRRISLGINDFDTTGQSAMLRRLPFLIEHVDSSDVDGAPVLNISLKEVAETVNTRHKGKREKVTVRGVRSNGVDEFIDRQNVQSLLDDLLREVDLYDNDITLMRNTFVSPLSPIAPDFYRFYLVDSTATVEGFDGPHISLAFYPRNKQSFGFSGHLYVAAGDTSMFVRRVEMRAPHDINLNFIDELIVEQNYDRAPDGSRLRRDDNLVMLMSVMPNTPQLYVSRKIGYRNHSFERPADADSIFGTLGDTHEMACAESRDSMFWVAERHLPEPEGESKSDLLMKRLRQKPVIYWGEKILRILSTGYVGTGPDSKFDIGPVNTFASYNSLEGLRLRAGGTTTAQLSQHWFGRGYVAYGFHDRKWKYSAEAEYSFNAKKLHSREFPVHSVRLSHRYDVDRLGSHYLYTNADNFVLSLSRMSDRRFSYLRESKLEYTLELENNFSVEATVSHRRQEASGYLRFITADGTDLGHFGMSTVGVRLRYAPGEKFYQTKSHRYPVNADAPVFELSHVFAPRDFAGSRYGLNRTELSVSKRVRMSLLGFLDLALAGGHVWGDAPFTELLIPNANLSYTIQPRSFALMNPMEFVNTSFVSLHATWHLRGLLFNRIPGVRKLGLREVVGFSGIWGHLSDKALPTVANGLPLFPEGAQMRGLGRTPYMEVSAGIDNIFRILRVDYVWRLSYTDVPYEIDRHGLRVALHFTF